MVMRLFETGMTAIREGKKAEGARFIRIALKADELPPAVAAVAYLWLAETTDDIGQKREYYNDALSLDPSNPDARERLVGLLTSGLPLAQGGQQPPSNGPNTVPVTPTTNVRNAPGEQLVRVIGGPNGPGTAFFVSTDGLLATTRFVTGGLERMTLELRSGRQVLGQVVRAWPDMDLAFIYTDERVSELLPITAHQPVPDEAPLTCFSAAGGQQRGKQRPTKRVMAAHWVPTDFVKLPDAGGDPLFDERNALVGMMTRNHSRASGYVYGVHISAIHRCVNDYFGEVTGGDRRIYCPGCGTASRATGAGYFYCDVCGAVAPLAWNATRYPQGDPFADPNRRRCPHCESQAGFYAGQCLRCGNTV